MGAILYTILIGAVIGALARLIKPGADPMGWILTILLGIAGSWVGNFLFGLVGLHGVVLELVGAVLGYAKAHRDVIMRFGRFPHRNAALGRENTPAEQAWLEAGGGF